jgi:hypothetical protein
VEIEDHNYFFKKSTHVTLHITQSHSNFSEYLISKRGNENKTKQKNQVNDQAPSRDR